MFCWRWARRLPSRVLCAIEAAAARITESPTACLGCLVENKPGYRSCGSPCGRQGLRQQNGPPLACLFYLPSTWPWPSQWPLQDAGKEMPPPSQVIGSCASVACSISFITSHDKEARHVLSVSLRPLTDATPGWGEMMRLVGKNADMSSS